MTLRRAGDSYRIVSPQILAHFEVLRFGQQRQLVHRIKDAPLGRLQPVARIGQRARDDDRHRVIEERSLNLFGNVNGLYFFVGVVHGVND